jgi:hypothetical protein
MGPYCRASGQSARRAVPRRAPIYKFAFKTTLSALRLASASSARSGSYSRVLGKVPRPGTTANDTDDADDGDGDHAPPFTRSPSFCTSSKSVPTALERLCPKALILMIRAPDRPSRPNASIDVQHAKKCLRAPQSSRESARIFCPWRTHGGVF